MVKSRSVPFVLFFLVFCSTAAFAQLTFDKPKGEPNLANPYTVGAKREDILKATRELFGTCAFPIDDVASKPGEGRIITKPIVFSRGVTTQSDLEYYATMPAATTRSWSQGRLQIEITSLPLDATHAQLSVLARVQGRVGGIIEEKWIDGVSTGNLEDEVIRGLAGKVLGLDLSRSGKAKRRIMNCEY